MYKQTAKLIARISENLPQIGSQVIQGWIDNPKALQKGLKDLLCPPEPIHPWREENGVIYFSVTSDGTTGKDWIKRLEESGFRFGGYAKQVLRTPSFKPTTGVSTEVAVLKGILFNDQSRITSKIRAEAARRKFEKPNAELACLIRLKFTDEEIEAMGLWWIVAMHEPIYSSNYFDRGPHLLLPGRRDGGRWLQSCGAEPGRGWGRDHGFAFAVSPQ